MLEINRKVSNKSKLTTASANLISFLFPDLGWATSIVSKVRKCSQRLKFVTDIEILPVNINMYIQLFTAVIYRCLFLSPLFSGNLIRRASLSEAMSKEMEELRKENDSLRSVIKIYKVCTVFYWMRFFLVSRI